MKCNAPRNNGCNINDPKELESMRKKYGVLNIEVVQSASKIKKYKIEFVDPSSYYNAYVKGIFLANDRVYCTPYWRFVPFCLQCSEWEHDINDCTSNFFICFYCGEKHDGTKCKNNTATSCKHCSDTHESFNSKCDKYKTLFKEQNKFIYDLLEQENSKLSDIKLEIMIPKTNHITYQIKNNANPIQNKNLETISKEISTVTSRLRDLEDFKDQQIKSNTELGDKITREVTKQVTALETKLISDNQSTRDLITQQRNDDLKRQQEDQLIRNALIAKLNIDLGLNTPERNTLHPQQHNPSQPHQYGHQQYYQQNQILNNSNATRMYSTPNTTYSLLSTTQPHMGHPTNGLASNVAFMETANDPNS